MAVNWLYISGFEPCTCHSGRVICFYYYCVLWCFNWYDLEINWIELNEMQPLAVSVYGPLKTILQWCLHWLDAQ